VRSEHDAQLALDKYADTVRRICFLYLKNYHDTEDVFQNVFLKYVLRDAPFESDEHEKAWIVRISINACKDLLRNFFRRKVGSIEDALTGLPNMDDSDRGVIDSVIRLPEKYRAVIYLHYYEGYSAIEIASILNTRENTVYTRLSRARALLKFDLGGDARE
jgi:RNA polymerase sigma-70 factor (ECF subfamily)